MNKKSIWSNKDGLYVGFGIRGAEANTASSLTAGDSNLRRVVLKVSAPTLQAAATGKELANSVFIPAGSNIKTVRVIVDTVFAGGTSVSLGGYTLADVADSATGFLNAVVTATLVAGYDNSYVAPGAGAGGAYLGTKLATAVKIAPIAAGTFTTGVATVTIEYEVPAN